MAATAAPPERLARWPVQHFRGCPAADDADLAAAVVEHYPDRYRTERARDVQHEQLGRRVMVAHCTKCGGMSYHDQE